MNDRGQGRKPLSKDGELMKSRPIRMTDAQWEDAKLVGMTEIREFVTKQAKKKRAEAAPSHELLHDPRGGARPIPRGRASA